jgi:type IV secretion system protein VirB4
VDAAWRARLSATPLFVNEQVLTLVRRPARGKAGWLERLGRKARGAAADEARARRELDSACAALLGALGGYGARLLGTVVQGGARWSEPLALLSALYNGEWRGVALPDGPGDVQPDLGHHLPYARVSFGLEAIETRRSSGRDFAAMISLKDYPDTTRAGMVDALLRLPHELVLTETFAPADRQIARERIDLALRRLKSADEEALAERAQMHAARDALGAGSTGFGDHHLTVMVRAESLPALEGASAAAMNALADLGAIAVREDVNWSRRSGRSFPATKAMPCAAR